MVAILFVKPGHGRVDCLTESGAYHVACCFLFKNVMEPYV